MNLIRFLVPTRSTLYCSSVVIPSHQNTLRESCKTSDCPASVRMPNGYTSHNVRNQLTSCNRSLQHKYPTQFGSAMSLVLNARIIGYTYVPSWIFYLERLLAAISAKATFHSWLELHSGRHILSAILLRG